MKKIVQADLEKSASSEPDIIYELGIEPGKGKLLIAERAFFLRTRPGPLTTINPGQTIAVSVESAEILFFAGKARPVKLPAEFEGLHNFSVTIDGDFVAVEPGDFLKLDEAEALPLMRKGLIRERKEA